MMILRSAPPSPFGRKIRIAAGLLGLDREIEIQSVDLTDPSDSVRQQNPLGKIPVLIAEDGKVYYDSRVVLEYLDLRAGGGIIVPRDPQARLDAYVLQALCDGILDAGILQVYEARYRAADKHDDNWLAYQAEKVARGLRALEAASPAIGPKPHVGHISLACALGYGDLRFGGAWRADHPKLVAWLDEFSRRVPAFEQTKFTA
jgi:glutathione S-transferase